MASRDEAIAPSRCTLRSRSDGNASTIQKVVVSVRSANQAITDAETGQPLVMTSPDQVVASGRLTDGAVATLHFRGGHFPGTNFHWEINGTEGDIVVTAPIGHIQLAPLTLLGARGDAAELAVLPVPESYRKVASLNWPATEGLEVADFYRQGAFGVAHLYQQFLEDLREGGNSVPDFSDAVVRHRSIHNASSMP